MSASDDVIAIQTLLARIAQLADTGEIVEAVACYTPDGVWELADATGLPLETGALRGHAEIEAGIRERQEKGVQGPGTHTRHDISTTVVSVDGDRATAASYFRFYREAHLTPVLAAMGRYDDVLLRTPGGWRLAHRVITR